MIVHSMLRTARQKCVAALHDMNALRQTKPERLSAPLRAQAGDVLDAQDILHVSTLQRPNTFRAVARPSTSCESVSASPSMLTEHVTAFSQTSLLQRTGTLFAVRANMF